MYCEKCGSELKDDVCFCSKCGEKVNECIEQSHKGEKNNAAYLWLVPIVFGNVLGICIPFFPVYMMEYWGEKISYQYWDLLKIPFCFRVGNEELFHYDTFLNCIKYSNLDNQTQIGIGVLLISFAMMVLSVLLTVGFFILLLINKRRNLLINVSKCVMICGCIYWGVTVGFKDFMSELLYVDFGIPGYVWCIMILNIMNLLVFHRAYIQTRIANK